MNARLMQQRRIDAWLAPRLMVIYAYREVGGDPADLGIGAIVRPSEIWLAASKSLPDAEARKWQQAFEAMRADGSYQRILAEYNQLKVEPLADDARRKNYEPVWTY